MEATGDMPKGTAGRWMKETKSYNKLPEKKGQTKTAGMFFENRQKPGGGQFFSKLAGRDDGMFFGKVAASAGEGMFVNSKSSTARTQTANAGASGAPVGGLGYRGEESSMGMNGTGEGLTNKEAEPGDEEERLQALLEKARTGEERPARAGDKDEGEKKKKSPEGAGEEEKTAAYAPSDGDEGIALTNGLHRPASEQPEALEAGGDRFFSTEASSPSYGTGDGHMKTKAVAQTAKHASAGRFLGTQYGHSKIAADINEEIRQTADQAKTNYGKAMNAFGEKAKSKVKQGVNWVTDPEHSERAAAGTALAAMLALGAGKRMFGGGRRALSRAAGGAEHTIGDRVSSAARALMGKA